MSDALLSAAAENTDAAPASSAANPAAQGTSLLATGEAATQQPAEAPPTEGKPASEAEGKPTEAPEGAPETYADFTLPEGAQVDAEVLSDVQSLAKSLNLTQENAQKVVDLLPKFAAKTQEAQTAHLQSMHAEWAQQSTNDAEFGGEKLAENLAKAKAAMHATATPQLQVLLDKSGLGNHPEVIRHFLKIAPAFASDTFVPGGKAPVGAGKSAAEVLYPNNP